METIVSGDFDPAQGPLPNEEEKSAPQSQHGSLHKDVKNSHETVPEEAMHFSANPTPEDASRAESTVNSYESANSHQLQDQEPHAITTSSRVLPPEVRPNSPASFVPSTTPTIGSELLFDSKVTPLSGKTSVGRSLSYFAGHATPGLSRFPLSNGTAVADYSLDKLLVIALTAKHQTQLEFTHVRCTAVTCGPKEFPKNDYKLRPQLCQPPRDIKLLIGLAAPDNEGIKSRLRDVAREMDLILAANQELTWQNIMICIGLEEPLPSNTANSLRNIGLLPFEEGRFFNRDGTAASHMGSTRSLWGYKYVQRINEKYRHISLFEYTTTLLQWKPSDKRPGFDPRHLPIQVILCIHAPRSEHVPREKGWFEAIAKQLDVHTFVYASANFPISKGAIFDHWQSKLNSPSSHVGIPVGQ